MTAEELVKLHIGNLVIQIVTLQTELERLRIENETLKAAAPSSDAPLRDVVKLS